MAVAIREDEYVLIWCYVCKKWLPQVRDADHCPRCGTDEIDRDE